MQNDECVWKILLRHRFILNRIFVFHFILFCYLPFFGSIDACYLIMLRIVSDSMDYSSGLYCIEECIVILFMQHLLHTNAWRHSMYECGRVCIFKYVKDV